MTASEINITIDEAVAKCPNLEEKIRHSVELIRKGEKMALEFDPENGYHLAFSGGKDSQVLYHITKMAGVRFKAHMNLTSVDPPSRSAALHPQGISRCHTAYAANEHI